MDLEAQRAKGFPDPQIGDLETTDEGETPSDPVRHPFLNEEAGADPSAPSFQAAASPPAPSAKSSRQRPHRLLAVLGLFFIVLLLGSAASGGVSWGLAALLSSVVGGAAALATWWAIKRGEMAPALGSISASQVAPSTAMALLDALPQPVLLVDGEDRIESVNAAAERLFGDGSQGQPITSVIRAPTALAVLREARHANEPREDAFTLSAPRSMAALFYAAPLASSAGRDRGAMVVMVRDRTEQRMLERMRTDFIANAGHELRTPLASILGFIETLQGHAKEDPDAQERFLGIMKAQTERMLRLVKDLVSLSSLELNERRTPEEEVDLCEVATVTCEMMAPVVEASGGRLRAPPSDCTSRIIGDRDQLMQVLQNLVDNALRYGGADDDQPADVEVSVGSGRPPPLEEASTSGDSPELVAVRAGCDASDLRFIRVRDHGAGIEPTDLPRLTERFYRIDVERSRSKGGTGLGLAIVKHIVGRHNGGILIESSEGRGAAFTCYFPPLVEPELDKPVT